MSDEQSEILSEEKSKSAVKRELEALKDLGRELVDLPARQLIQVTLDDTTRTAIIDAHGMKKGALKRQLRYIGSLLKNEDAAIIRTQLDRLEQPHRQQVRAHHEVEQWRDSLIAGDDLILPDLASRFADLDRQYLMQLVRNARKEQQQEKPPKSARTIFQYLKDLQENEQ
jgi:ribosome-associated protein